MSKTMSIKQKQKILNLVNSDTILKVLDIVGFNYSVIDAEGNYIAQNSLMSKDITKGEKKAENIDKKSWKDCEKVMQKGKRKIIEEEFEGRYYLSIKNPLFERKKCVGIVVLSLDITERKQAEIAKSEFINSIHHDIKNPFVGLYMLSESMAKKEKNAKKKEGLSIISNCAKRLSEYFNKILDKISGDRNIQDEQNVFNIKEVINNAVHIIKPLLIDKKLKLDIRCPDREITSNKFNVELICLNLLSNAVKFTQKGHVTVECKIKNGKLTIAVMDTGIGISEKYQEIIFEKFQRVTPGYLEPEYRGCGLGLNIVKTLVDKMKGKIHLISAPDQGSTFEVWLPL